MRRWYVVHCHSNREQEARGHLTAQGFDVYLPLYQKSRRHARKTELVAKPLFPRYLFVQLDLNVMLWRKINSTRGVVRMVCLGDDPTPVPDKLVHEIRSREDGNGWVVPNIADNFRQGDPVQIISGSMRDLRGMFHCGSDKDRVIVLLNLLGREVKVALPSASIWSPA